jgi:molecular chaperone GrpE
MSDDTPMPPPARKRETVPGGALDLSRALADALASVESHEKPGDAPAAEPASAPPMPPATRQTPAAATPIPPEVMHTPIAGTPVPAETRASLLAELHTARLAAADHKLQLKRAQDDTAQVQADLQASRKRFEKLGGEVEDLSRRLQKAELDGPGVGARRVLLALAPVLDDVERVLGHLHDSENLSPDGLAALDMVAAALKKALAALQVQAFDAVGQRFDPFVHEVVAQVDDPAAPPGHVVRQAGRGYLLEGRLLRSAQVVVRPASTAGGEDLEPP